MENIKVNSLCVYFRPFGKYQQRANSYLIYFLYFGLVLTVCTFASGDALVNILAAFAIFLLLLSRVDDLMAPMYKEFLCKNVALNIGVSDKFLYILRMNVFDRLYVYRYNLEDVEEIRYNEAPGRLVIKGKHIDEIHLSYEHFNNKAEPVSHAENKTNSLGFNVDTEQIMEVVKLLKDNTEIQVKEL